MYLYGFSSVFQGGKSFPFHSDLMTTWFDLDNRIVQGDPLSMLLYLFYNADMLDIAQG